MDECIKVLAHTGTSGYETLAAALMLVVVGVVVLIVRHRRNSRRALLGAGAVLMLGLLVSSMSVGVQSASAADNCTTSQSSGSGTGDETGNVTRAATVVALNDRDCADFATQADAQAYFVSHGGSPSNNVDKLDADADGIACEDPPAVKSLAPEPPADPIDSPAEPVVVTPLAPTLVAAPSCGIAPTVTTPTVEGVTYEQSLTGNLVTVTASPVTQPAPGFVFAEGALATWTFDVTPEICPCVPANPMPQPVVTGYPDGDNYVFRFDGTWLADFEAVGGVFTSVRGVGEAGGTARSWFTDTNETIAERSWDQSMTGQSGTITNNGDGTVTVSNFAPSDAVSLYRSGTNAQNVDAINHVLNAIPYDSGRPYEWSNTGTAPVDWTLAGHYDVEGCQQPMVFDVNVTTEFLGGGGGGNN